ncbi:MAG: hypothetical protein RMZ95_011555 [Nostoc sp. DedQUE07]
MAQANIAFVEHFKIIGYLSDVYDGLRLRTTLAHCVWIRVNDVVRHESLMNRERRSVLALRAKCCTRAIHHVVSSNYHRNQNDGIFTH